MNTLNKQWFISNLSDFSICLWAVSNPCSLNRHRPWNGHWIRRWFHFATDHQSRSNRHLATLSCFCTICPFGHSSCLFLAGNKRHWSFEHTWGRICVSWKVLYEYLQQNFPKIMMPVHFACSQIRCLITMLILVLHISMYYTFLTFNKINIKHFR